MCPSDLKRPYQRRADQQVPPEASNTDRNNQVPSSSPVDVRGGNGGPTSVGAFHMGSPRGGEDIRIGQQQQQQQQAGYQIGNSSAGATNKDW